MFIWLNNINEFWLNNINEFYAKYIKIESVWL